MSLQQQQITAPVFRVFLWRVTALHMITYFIAGGLAYTIVDYPALYATGTLQYLMKPVTSVWIAAGPALQVFRGVLFAAILWPFRSLFLSTQYGWLRLWALFAGLAILGTAGPSPGSFEGIIYSRLSLYEHLIGLPETLLQTMLFALLLYAWCQRPKAAYNKIAAVLLVLVVLLSVAGYYGARQQVQ